MGITFRHFAAESDWREEALRTNLWLIPVELTLPSWVISGSPDAARQILSSLAAAIITVVGVVFSIMIVTLTLASSQFGPRLPRTFIRDRGTQLTLGTFVATFLYATWRGQSTPRRARPRDDPASATVRRLMCCGHAGTATGKW